jgi:hypothetical protein
MIGNVEASRVNAAHLADMLAPHTQVKHLIMDIESTAQYLYQPRGWWDDWRRYGSYACSCVCNGCDLAMMVHTILYCVQHGIPLAFDGGSRTEFAGFLDAWGMPKIQALAAEYGVRWEYPSYAEDRADLAMLEIGLDAAPPRLLYRSQPRCRGGGIATNLYMRCYYLPRYGADGYRRITLRWLEDRLELARGFINQRIASTAPRVPSQEE